MDKRKLLLGLLWDVGVPAVVFYAARALGVDALPALAAGSAAALLRVAWVAVVRRRLDGLAGIVGVSFGLLLVVSLLTGDPRILLVRESVLSGAAGLLMTGSCLLGRPLVYAVARRFMDGSGKQEVTAQWDERWRTQPAFRRHFFVLSAVPGVVLLAESVVRVVLVYSLPVDVMAGLTTVLHLGTIGLLVGWLLWYRTRRRAADAGSAAQVAGEPTRAR
ncbi:DUF3159 domain-containing protein [Flindersiella endophytica]